MIHCYLAQKLGLLMRKVIERGDTGIKRVRQESARVSLCYESISY
jgi:hypothetical protein